MATVRRTSNGLAVKLPKMLKEIGRMESQVGWFEGAKYGTGEFVASVAAQNEFGNSEKRIPPRSFMRTTAAENRGAWIALAESGARAMIAGNASPLNVMEGIGQQAEGDVRKKITTIWKPELAEVTIENRLKKLADGKTIGNLTKPLVESGYMLASLTSVVK